MLCKHCALGQPVRTLCPGPVSPALKSILLVLLFEVCVQPLLPACGLYSSFQTRGGGLFREGGNEAVLIMFLVVYKAVAHGRLPRR